MANSRNEVPANRKWNTAHIYEDHSLWEKDYKWVEQNIDFAKYQGKLNNVQTIKDCFNDIDKVSLVLEKLYVYASMRSHEDTRESFYNGLLARAQGLFVKFSSAVSFMTPELTKLSSQTLTAFSKDPALSDYSYDLERIIAEKPHVLSEETE
ncbi:MAG: oligoendopeptidase F, partial [Clostridia bacterium]|nr:oligoendopeptidase F [Clostridia bacterium]